MEAIQIIEQYISEPDESGYFAALGVFLKHGKNKNLVKHLSKGPNKYNLFKLQSELKKIRAKLNRQGVKVRQPVTQTVSTDRPLPERPERKPKTSNSTTDNEAVLRRNELFTKASRLHASLGQIATPKQRLPIIKELMAVWDQLDTEHMKADYYEQFGEELTTEMIHQHKADLIGERNNLRTYVSKIKKKIKNATDTEDKKKLELRLAEKSGRLEMIESQLDAN